MTDPEAYAIAESDNLDLLASSKRLRRTALHEAAHAICASSVFFSQQRDNGIQVPGGIFLTHISVVETDETWGHYGLWAKTDSQITLGAIDMAGAVFTYLSTGSMRGVLYDARGDADFVSERLGVRTGDILSAWGSLLVGEPSIANAEWFTILRDSFLLCRTIIESRWNVILALADHLLDVKQMGVRAIQKWLGEHQIHAREWGNNEQTS